LAAPGDAVGQRSVDDVHAESFAAAWRIIYTTHPDTSFNGVNWVALGDSLRPRATGVSRDSVRTLIRAMLARLNQSHFALIPREDADPPTPATGSATVGLDVRLLGSEVVVTAVDPGGPADLAGVRPGWVLVAVDTILADALLGQLRQRQSRYSLAVRVWGAVRSHLQGREGDTVRLRFRDQADQVVELVLTRRQDDSLPVKFGDLPTFYARFGDQLVHRGVTRAGVIWFNTWMAPLLARLDSAVEAYRDAHGIVLDLRGNQGGLGAMVSGVAGHFTPQADTLGSLRTRTAELFFISNPRTVSPDGRRVQPFQGPVAILLDELSGSASEVFAGGLQALGRARVFGQTSLGAVLPAVWHRLPNGDVLYHAIGDFRTARGVLLEGRGVIPDEPVQLSRAALLADRDPVLEAALDWIARAHSGRLEGGLP
jgi:carboxyl-terminal processing protease